MKLDQLAFRLFRQAYHAVLASPGDAKAHARFDKWAKLVGRIVGLPITGYHETHGPGRAQWVRATAAALIAVMTTHYAAGVWLNPSKPEKPAPPRGAIGQLTVVVSSTDTGVSSGYFWNTVTGQQFLGMPPLNTQATHAGHMREAPMIAPGSTVYLKPDGPDVTIIEHNRDGTIKLALFDGTRDHHLDVLPDAVALSSERVENFKRAAAEQAAVEYERRTRYPRQMT